MDDQRDESNQHCSWADLHLWQIRFIRDILIGLVIFLLFWLGYAMRDVTVPLLVALLLAYLAEPAIRWCSDCVWIPFKRLGGVILFLGVFIVLILALVAFVIPPAINQVLDLIDEIETGVVRTKLVRLTDDYAPDRIRPDLIELIEFLPSGHHLDSSIDLDLNTGEDGDKVKSDQPTRQGRLEKKAAPAPLGTNVDSKSLLPNGEDTKILSSVRQKAAANAGTLIGIVKQGGSIAWSVVLEVFTIAMLMFLIPFYFFFFSLWYPHVSQFLDSMIPERDRDQSRVLLKKMDAAVSGFVRGRILIAIIMSVMFVFGYMFIGVPYAIILGIFAGFISIVPYLGLVAIPISILLLLVGQLEVPDADRMAWWGILLWPSVIYAIVGNIDGWVLTPWIQGKSTNLDPVTIFVAILAGGSVLGVYGMLISIPVAACVKIMLSDVVIPKLREMGARPRAGKPLT